MKHLLILTPLLLAGAVCGQTEVSVALSSHATAVERLAGEELASHLQLLYPSVRFTVRARAAKGATVL